MFFLQLLEDAVGQKKILTLGARQAQLSMCRHLLFHMLLTGGGGLAGLLMTAWHVLNDSPLRAALGWAAVYLVLAAVCLTQSWLLMDVRKAHFHHLSSMRLGLVLCPTFLEIVVAVAYGAKYHMAVLGELPTMALVTVAGFFLLVFMATTSRQEMRLLNELDHAFE